MRTMLQAAPLAGAVSFPPPRAGPARPTDVASFRTPSLPAATLRRARHVAPRTDLRPPRLAAALAGSLAFHAAVVGLLALLVGIGASGPGKPHDAAPLRATLAARAVLATPPEAPAQPTPPRPAYAPVVRVPVTASLPVPLRPAVAKPAAAERYEGLVSILPDDGSALDPDVARAVAALYPAAMRGPVEFDVPRS